MATCHTKILRVSFDVSDDQMTNVRVEVSFWGDCPMQLKRVYEKSFPARIPITELAEKYVPDYLSW